MLVPYDVPFVEYLLGFLIGRVADVDNVLVIIDQKCLLLRLLQDNSDLPEFKRPFGDLS
jgi:hypothetical protein